MHIRDWPSHERPREKLLARGAGSLSDAELLALFLGSGTAGRDAVATARDLLAEHGPLRALLDRSAKDMTRLNGIGDARACALSAALELGHRHLAAQLERGDALTDPAAAGRYFARRLRGQPREVFAALYLDTRHRALGFEELFQGSIDGAEVHPRVLVERALAHGAAAHRAGPGDIIIICAYGVIAEAEAAKFKPTLVYVDRHNRLTHTNDSIPPQAA